MDSTGALELKDVPKRLLIIGGGIIGLEMATVYDALGSKVTVVEFMDRLIPGADPDIVKPLAKRIEKRYEKILLKTKVAKIEAPEGGPARHLRERRRRLAGARSRRSTTACCWRWAAGPTGRTSPRKRRA